MASDGGDQDARYALSKLLQRGTVTEYERKSFNIERENTSIVLSWPSEEAPPVIEGSLDANEDIGVVEVSSAIDGVFDIGESNVESMKVRSEFSEFLENKESVEEVVVGGGEACGVGEYGLNIVISVLKDGDGEFDDRLNEINLDLSHEFVIRVLKNRDVFGESLVVLLNPIWVPILWGYCVYKSILQTRNVAHRKGGKKEYRSRIKIFVRHRLEDKGYVKELAPTTLGEAFSIARIIEARFESIAGKKLNIEEKIDIVLSWPTEKAPPVIEGSLYANEDIGVVEVSSAIDDVFDIGESNVESMKVCSEFSEFSENKESVEEVVVGGGEACGVGEYGLNIVISPKDGDGEFDDRLNEINLDLSHEFVTRVLENRDVFGESLVELLNPIWVPILWGVSGFNKSSFANKDVAMGKEAKRIWDPGIKIFFRHHLEDKARFESIAGKKLNIEEKIDIVLSWPSEEAPPVIEGSLDANEDIGVVEVSSAIDGVFDIGESNVESMKVRSEFSEFLENKESVEEVVVGGGEACGVGEYGLNIVISVLKDGDGEFDDRLNEINLDLSHEFVIRVLENRDVFGESLVVLLNPIWVPILWGVSGVNKSSFANKDVAMGKEAKRIWDPGIKIFLGITLRTRSKRPLKVVPYLDTIRKGRINMLGLFIDNDKELDFKLVIKLHTMALELSARVRERGELILELKRLPNSFDDVDGVKLLLDLQESDIAKVRSIWTIITDTQLKVVVKVSSGVELRHN
ncbi:hypothetical protein Tco_0801829 [Tanacetum coccineum]|uniref:DUF4283 domain-containing protein n=1 Tax=Tanacetum coccineum TaxID=301880 RepID=A0ABQ4ZZT5_9ASTR